MAKNEVKKVIVSLSGFTKELAQRLTLKITSNLQEATPVDTGWARANWVPSIGQPFRGFAGSREKINGSLTAEGVAKVATSYQFSQGPIYVSNNVPYMRYLNEGSSLKAPAGFVQAAVQKAIGQVTR